jgi:hypothetical protein
VENIGMEYIDEILSRYKRNLDNYLNYNPKIPSLITPKFIPRNGSKKAITPKQLIQSNEGIAIIGDTGCGKSVAQTFLAKFLLKKENEKRIPLFIKDEIKYALNNQKEKNIGNIITHIFDKFNRFIDTKNSNHASEVLKKLAEESRLVIFIDGIDEIDRTLKSKSGDGIVFYLNQVIMKLPYLSRCQFIVSSRKNRYEDCKMEMWNNKYEPIHWDKKRIFQYFNISPEIIAIFTSTRKKKTLLNLFRLPMFCYLTYQLVKGQSDFLNEEVDQKRMEEVLPAEHTYLYTRFLTKSWLRRDAVKDKEVLLEALSFLAPKISGHYTGEDEIWSSFQEYFGIELNKAKEIYSGLVDAGIILREDDKDYVKFSHESYREYFVAYRIFKLLISFKERKNEFFKDVGNLTEKGRSFFDEIGSVLPTVEIYTFLRDLSSGYIHTRKQFPGKRGLKFYDVLVILDVALRGYEQDLKKRKAPDEIKNIFIVLLQLIRGYLYRKSDDKIASNIDESLDKIKATLQTCCRKEDIILRREAAATLAGLDNRSELEKVIADMIDNKDFYNYHRSFIYKVWGVVEGDQDKIRNASRTAWEIINSNEGHRPKLKILNIFSLAQFSNQQNDIYKLEELKKENEKKKRENNQEYDEFLNWVIDESIKLIERRIKRK